MEEATSSRFLTSPLSLSSAGHWDSYMLTTETQFQEGKPAAGAVGAKGDKIGKGERKRDGVRWSW